MMMMLSTVQTVLLSPVPSPSSLCRSHRAESLQQINEILLQPGIQTLGSIEELWPGKSQTYG